MSSSDTLQEKLKYIWYYYKNYIIVFLISLSLMPLFISTFTLKSNTALNFAIVALDVSEEELSDLHEDLYTFIDDIIPSNDNIVLSLSNDPLTYNRFVTEWTSGNYDLILMHPIIYNELKSNDTFADFIFYEIGTQQNESPFKDYAEVADIPFFSNYSILEDLYMIIPKNKPISNELKDFFEKQLIIIEQNI